MRDGTGPTTDALLLRRLEHLLPKPPETASAPTKKRFGELLSAAAAEAMAESLRAWGIAGAKPLPVATRAKGSGAERRMAGGIGAKKVDVSWATEESGLLLGLSIKSITARDRRSRNFQKNLMNRRGDMLFESVTLHRRFPFAVLGGLFILDAEAARDNTPRRRSTFENAHVALRLFSGRRDPAGRDEQYEQMYLCVFDTDPASPSLATYRVEDLRTAITLDEAIADLLSLIAERNPDFYSFSPSSGFGRAGLAVVPEGDLPDTESDEELEEG